MDIRRLEGMTTNERLVLSGKMHDFDIAVGKGDARRIRSILEELRVDEESILIILNDIHKN